MLFNKAQSLLIQYPAGITGSYIIPNSVTSIGASAFSGCTGLTSVTIPNSVTNIGAGAFYYCSGLTSVTIPNSVTRIGDRAFFDCTGLTAIQVDPLNGNYSSLAGVLFNKAQSLLIQYPAGITGSYMIPNSVTSIGASAFSGCSALGTAFFQGNAPIAGLGAFASSPTVCYYLPGQSGWGGTYSGQSAYLWNPAPQSTGPNFGVRTNRFGFNITGTADIPIVVEACTNLANATWVPLRSLNLTNGTFYFSDPDWTNYPARNYRIRSP